MAVLLTGGAGYSVLDMVHAFSRACGKETLPHRTTAQRRCRRLLCRREQSERSAGMERPTGD